jgi:hypothetical protein
MISVPASMCPKTSLYFFVCLCGDKVTDHFSLYWRRSNTFLLLICLSLELGSKKEREQLLYTYIYRPSTTLSPPLRWSGYFSGIFLRPLHIDPKCSAAPEKLYLPLLASP